MIHVRLIKCVMGVVIGLIIFAGGVEGSIEKLECNGSPPVEGAKCILVKTNGFDGVYFLNGDVTKPLKLENQLWMKPGRNGIEVGAKGYQKSQIGFNVTAEGILECADDSIECDGATLTFQTVRIEVDPGKDFKMSYIVSGFTRVVGKQPFQVVRDLGYRAYPSESSQGIPFFVTKDGAVILQEDDANRAASYVGKSTLYFNNLKIWVDPGSDPSRYTLGDRLNVSGFTEETVVPNIALGVADAIVLPNQNGVVPDSTMRNGKEFRFGVAPNVWNVKHWWRANGNTKDEIAQTLTQSTVSYGSGVINKAFKFDGNQSVPLDVAKVLLTKESTVTLWFKWNGPNSGQTPQAILGTCDPKRCKKRGPEFSVSEGKLFVSLGDSETTDTEKRIEPNRWYHVALSYKYGQRVSNTGPLYTVASVYLDGVLIKDFKTINFDNGFAFDPGLTIGNSPDKSKAGFNGMVDEVRVYWRRLENHEVRWIYFIERGFRFEIKGGATSN